MHPQLGFEIIMEEDMKNFAKQNFGPKDSEMFEI